MEVVLPVERVENLFEVFSRVELLDLRTKKLTDRLKLETPNTRNQMAMCTSRNGSKQDGHN